MAKLPGTTVDEIIAHFNELEDPRSPINRQHPLVSVVVIALMAVLAGAGGPTAVAPWGDIEKKVLPQGRPVPAGHPPQGRLSAGCRRFESGGFSARVF